MQLDSARGPTGAASPQVRQQWMGAFGGLGASTSTYLGKLMARFGLGDVVGPSRASSKAQPGKEPSPEEALVAKRYTPGQLEDIQPEARSYVVKHHDALIKHGFSRADIVRLGNRFQSLKIVANRYADLKAAIPDLTRAQIVNIGSRRSGNAALEELLRTPKNQTRPLGAELTRPPLRLSAAQIAAIGATGKRPALQAVHRLGSALTSAPLKLSVEQVVCIASHKGGKSALEAVKELWPHLLAVGLNKKQVVAIASNTGGKQALMRRLNHPSAGSAATATARLGSAPGTHASRCRRAAPACDPELGEMLSCPYPANDSNTSQHAPIVW